MMRTRFIGTVQRPMQRCHAVAGSSCSGGLTPSSLLASHLPRPLEDHSSNGNARLCRLYHTGAHPVKKPEYALPTALTSVLKDIHIRRNQRRAQNRRVLRGNGLDPAKIKHHPNAPGFDEATAAADVAVASTDSTATASEKDDSNANTTKNLKTGGLPRLRKHANETIELSLNMNLDPRLPGQAVRGTLTLPHGTGRKGPSVAVISSDADVVATALARGAVLAGGADLVTELVDKGTSNKIPLGELSACLATKEDMALLRPAARVFGPKGLMPNLKVGTLCADAPGVLEALDTRVQGNSVEYRADKEGIIHVPVGKSAFGHAKLLENLGAVMAQLYDDKPDVYGRKKKAVAKKKGQTLKKTHSPYVNGASLTSTQGKGFKIDVRTVDPNNPFFLGDPSVSLAAAPAVPVSGKKMAEAAA